MIDLLGVIVKNARIRAKLTQEELSVMMGVSSRHIMYIENSRQKPSYNLLFRLIRALSIPADWIFYPELNQTSNG